MTGREPRRAASHVRFLEEGKWPFCRILDVYFYTSTVKSILRKTLGSYISPPVNGADMEHVALIHDRLEQLV